MILTAAAGGIRADLTLGNVVVLADQLNLTGRSPLGGPDFVDMVDAYSPALRTGAGDAGPGRRRGAGRTAGGLRAAGGAAVRDARRDPHARDDGGRRRGHVGRPRDDRRPAAGVDVLGLAVVTNPAAAAGRLRGVAAIASIGAAASPAVAAIVRHVVGSLS